MTREDIDNIISIICPNDEDFEKPIISPAYLKKELETLALEQEPTDRIEYGTDGNAYKLWVSNGKEYEPSGDAISREWLKTAIHNFYYGLTHTPTEEDIQAYIDVAPSVKQEPKTGHWTTVEMTQDGCRYTVTYCSECDEDVDYRTDYCPNCGCRMVEPQESEVSNADSD